MPDRSELGSLKILSLNLGGFFPSPRMTEAWQYLDAATFDIGLLQEVPPRAFPADLRGSARLIGAPRARAWSYIYSCLAGPSVPSSQIREIPILERMGYA